MCQTSSSYSHSQNQVCSFLLVGWKFFRRLLKALHLAISVENEVWDTANYTFSETIHWMQSFKSCFIQIRKLSPVWVSWPLTSICTKFKRSMSFFTFSLISLTYRITFQWFWKGCIEISVPYVPLLSQAHKYPCWREFITNNNPLER